MIKLPSFYRFWIPLSLIAATFQIHIDSAAAQTLSVESKSISNGTVDVPTTVDISITFSEAISNFGLPDVDLASIPIDLGITNEGCTRLPALVVITPSGCPQSWSLVDDGRTLVLKNVDLVEDQVHSMLVLFAVSTEGVTLGSPDITRFSTGSSIPQGSVSGVVSSDEIDATGSLVVLTRSNALDLITEVDSTGLDPLIGFADDSGEYMVTFVPDGEYFALSVRIDLRALIGSIAPVSKIMIEGIGVGLYDGNKDAIADNVTVSSGGAVSNIDVVLHSGGGTIKELQGPVEAMVVAEVSTARLSLAAGAGLEPDGDGLTWTYVFTDFFSGQVWVSVGLGKVAFPPVKLDENEDAVLIVFLLSTARFSDFADSDKAMEWFLAGGGKDFLDANPGALGAGIIMDRLLLDVLLETIRRGGGSLVPGSTVWRKVLQYDHLTEGLRNVLSKHQANEAWVIAFLGTGPDQQLHLVAAGDDGTPLLVIGFSAAAANTKAADQEAANWAGDASLVGVGTMEALVSSDGTAAAWSYSYYSASEDSVLNVVVSGGEIGGALSQSVVAKENLISIESLIQDWIDSPAAVAAADEIAADFLASHVGTNSTAILTMGLQPGHPGRGIWRVTYTGVAGDGTNVIKVVDIDASDGVYVAVEPEHALPSAFALDQNYPNPFNPETVIPYRIDESVEVRLAVFNVLGQQVRLLVNELLAAGAYAVRWDARDESGSLVPSGTYFYRLQTERVVETRRMSLVR
jgi:hypothetical protein